MNTLDMRNSEIKIEWQQFKKDTKRLAALIKAQDPYRLFGVVRGGLFVTLQVAQFLQMPKVYPLYPPKYRSSTLPSTADAAIPGCEDVIIDDVYEKGCTYREIQTKYSSTPFFILYSKTEALPREIVVGRRIITSKYIYLPWE